MGSRGCRIDWYNFRWPWVTPDPGFKVTGYLKVEYLADGARVLYKAQLYITRGSTENVQKIGGRRWKCFANSAGKCFTPVMEIKNNSVSLRWNFYADIQLIRGRFWLQLWTVKKVKRATSLVKIPCQDVEKFRNDFGVCSDSSSMGGRMLLALRSVAPAAAGRLQAEQAVKRTDCWAWLAVTPMADRL